jgi:type II secretory ATPase GspE/PulE/Tfp pilus assembly ATPase PilB-like protein
METIEITPQLRDLIAKGASESELKDAAKNAGLNTLRDNGLRLSQQGLTTIAEVIRATSGE